MKKEVTLGVKQEFDACHFLPDYPGKCANMHGHTWIVEAEFKGEVDPATGFVTDLARLKEMVKFVIADMDHQNLNQLLAFPTCENLSILLTTRLEGCLGDGPVRLTRVKIQEGKGGWAICLSQKETKN